MTRWLLAACLAFAAAPSSGLAGTVYYDSSSLAVVFSANQGEVNDIEASEAGGTLTIRDNGAVLVAGTGCTQVDDHEATCAATNVAYISLGDLDDTVAVLQGGSFYVYGDAGNDEMTACATCDVDLEGGSGADVLVGSDGIDRLLGETGNDTITGGGLRDWIEGGPGNDTIDGGGGSDLIFPGWGNDTVDAGVGFDDTVGYGWTPGTVGVVIDLRAGRATGRGTDTILGFESALGTRYADFLIGNSLGNGLSGLGGVDTLEGGGGNDSLVAGVGPGDDRLFGGRGNDRLVGGRNDDLLVGGPGRDRLFGYGGDDRLRSRDRFLDRLHGGPGNDRAQIDELDIVRGIERVAVL